MNQKIYKQLMADTGGDVSQITREYVAQTFDALIDNTYKTVEQWTIAIDTYCLNRYFSRYWQADMKKWKYSGLQLIDEVNALHPRAVLDVGCGYNEFRGRINNLIGIDPYNDNADYKIATLDYKSKEKFDVILCLGSINFGTQDKIVREVAHCVSMLAEGGTMFFRVNPGVQHDKPEAHWIEFFAWNVPFIIDLAQQLKLKILDIRDDSNQRKYFIYRKV
jgi:SAM-dependent methyltransferase